MGTSMERIVIFLLLSSSIPIQKICSAVLDTITATQSMTDGDTLVSSGGSFEMGFFSPGNSENRYVGIWYKKISVQTVIWVANREVPLTNTSTGQLKLISSGILILLNGTNGTVWSSNTSRPARNPIAQLLDSGNLVVRDKMDNNPDNFLWQSFDYPTNTFMPGMKFGKNFVTGKEWFLSSWKSNDDPAPGDYTWSCDSRGYPQNILKKSSVEVFRGGPWNGVGFSGGTALSSITNMIFTYNMVMNENEVFYNYTLKNSSVVTRLVLSSDGAVERRVWVEHQQDWVLYLKIPKDNCDVYLVCGAYGSCNISNSPQCGCLDNTKFVPKHRSDWDRADWSGGCERRRPLDCENGSDVFLKYSQVKFPDTRYSRANSSMSLQECRAVCLKNCTCMAYANLDVRNGGSGCLLWFNDLIDIRVYPDGAAGQDIFVRMAFSELEDLPVAQSDSRRKKGENIKVVFLIVFLGMVVIVLSLILFLYAWKKKNVRQQKEEGASRHDYEQNNNSQRQEEALELPLFDLSTVHNATCSFSANNKLGEGGFGPVYKGVLEGGQEIAVKRLSRTSSQGIDEFKNEVICISKLQHRNLVKLIGCCIQGDEKLLIYEFLPNKSLDSFIFDKMQSLLLDWPKRFHIINGIARGLLYLHQDSRLRIIHRDLKASNVLLDYDMNPKISDFGIARSFGGNETQANTNRVVGTYGYMSPEYAVDGIFSTKSDVFSFGVLVLEIVSGKRNRGFVHQDHDHNLLGHVWRLYNEGRSLELIDAIVTESCYLPEVLRAIQVGLLCVQQGPEDRPSMSSVVLMLGSEGALPRPKQPGFFTERNIIEVEYYSSTHPTSSVCEFTDTLVDGR